MRQSKRLSCAAFALVTLAVSVPAAATHLEIQAGRSYMSGFPTDVAFAESVFDSRRIGDSRFSWSPDVSLGWIRGRDLGRYNHSDYTTRDDVWLLAAGVRLRLANGGGWFFGAQGAAQSGRTQALSSGYEFVSTLGWQGRRFSFQVRHISNAGLHEPNRGETMALVGVGFDL